VLLLLVLPKCQEEYLVLGLPAVWCVLADRTPTGHTCGHRAAQLMVIGAYLLGNVHWPKDPPILPLYRTGWHSLLVTGNFWTLWLLLAGVMTAWIAHDRAVKLRAA
jgi:hypothetical protein